MYDMSSLIGRRVQYTDYLGMHLFGTIVSYMPSSRGPEIINLAIKCDRDEYNKQFFVTHSGMQTFIDGYYPSDSVTLVGG